TNIGPAHLEGLKTLEMVREEKGELFRNLSDRGVAVINGDDEAVRTLALRWSGKRVTYGLTGDSDVTAKEIVSGQGGVRFTLKIGTYEGKVALAAAGTHNVMNALAAAAAARALDSDYEVIRMGLQAFKPMPGRMEIHRLGNGAFLIDDSYNANPLSVREALISLKALKGGHKSTAILGDMLELGEQAEMLHEEIGRVAWETGVDHLLLKGVFSPATAAGAKRKGMPASRIGFPSAPEDIGNALSSSLQEGDWVLVKGSRAMKMEEAIKVISEKFGFADRPEKG
ncbi:MAG: UDP-N-acetylmuramoyl-tripeptide--D-alanyl-D-alanine ligase, partial [Syntrophales bacterium LBB04]|nr:UDP-N-acetylmuramoyl-tripeptide--D-alanyl-D-alanine ligase [Syntrophales bacterium LBB04]